MTLHHPRDESVFINCPYDKDHADFFETLILSVASCAYYPHSFLELIGLDVPHIDRGADLMRSCKYSIHDLSCKKDLPTELVAKLQAGHGGAAFVEVGEMALIDLNSYRWSHETLARYVMSWLCTVCDAVRWRDHATVISAIPKYHACVSRLSWSDPENWKKRLNIAYSIINALPFEK